MSRIRIEVLNGSDAGRSFESDADVVRIGRSPECELKLPSQHVSGQHARIAASGSGFTVVDLGSANGSVLVRGGERVELDNTTEILSHGDELLLGGDAGEATRLRVSLGEEASAAPEVVSTRSLQEL